ncbi:PEP-utilizing enzyme [Phaeodactylibacter sp.]|uniref:PEP-utilizing enzyme n=1 Tax=Phaeodactylibacter sp. TaxID=1940289 RepID=UPI0032EEDE64
MDSKHYHWLGERDLSPLDCGPKAIYQNQLKRQGYRVPEGLVVPYDRFERFCQEAGLHPQDTQEQAAERIRSSGAANVLLQSLLAAFPEGKPLILRTAASAEDRPGQTMAGHFASPAGLTTLKDLQQAFAEVWATANSREITENRLSLLLQAYIPTEFAGLTFTLSPTAPKAAEMILELAAGSCEALTAGHSPDARLNFNWRRQELNGRIPPALAQLVSSKQIIEFGVVFLSLQKQFGCPQDIEWGVKNGQLYIFQCRPITQILFPAETIWTNANFRDGGIGAEMPSPLMWDLYKMTFDYSIDAFSRRYHITPDEPPRAWSTTFLGYPYWNLAATKSGARKVMGYVERRFDEGQGVTPYYKGKGEQSKLTLKRISTSVKALTAIRKSIKTRFAVCRQTKAYFQDIVRPEFKAAPFDPSSTAEIGQYFKRLATQHLMYVYSNYWEIIYDNTFVSTFTQNAIERYNRRRGLDLQFTDVTAGLDHVAHLHPLNALQQLAAQIRSDEPAYRWWKPATATALLEAWRTGKPFPYRARLADFLDKYGYKSTRELEIMAPNWIEDPTAVLQALQQYLDLPPAPVSEHTEHQTFQKIRHQLPQSLVRKIERQRKFLWWKEEIRDITTQLMHFIRLTVVALGKSLVQDGLLHQAEDAFFLTHQELIHLAQSSHLPADYRERIQYRRCIRASFRNYQKPDIIFPNPVLQQRHSGKSSGLNGIGVCQGVVEGPAVVIAELNESFDPGLLHGRILVTEYINPGHLSYFPTLKGLITANGGLLSHAAIICRELGIPAVFGIPDATRKIPDNARLQLNGKTGEVAILAK